MRIALINGSPKSKNSVSECILKDLRGLLKSSNCIIDKLQIRKPQITKEEMEQLTECNALVFAFPIYVDGIPSHLLSCLVDLEMHFAANENKDISVYALVNCGFYEAHQTKLAIEMMENWCAKAGLKWGQGIGIGAGGMISSLKGVPLGRGPKKSLEMPFKQLAGNIVTCAAGENLFVTPVFPRILYKLAAEMGWRRSIKANGLIKKRFVFEKVAFDTFSWLSTLEAERMWTSMVVMETERLIIRNFMPDDWQDLYEYLSIPDVLKYEPEEASDEAECRKKALERSQDNIFWAVCLKESAKMIGHVCIFPIEPAEFLTWEIGYIFNPGYYGKGYATEACRRILQYGFEELGAHRIIAMCSPENIKSWKLLERLSMRREGHFLQKAFFRKNPEGKPLWHDAFEYAMLETEWERSKASLDSFL